MYKAPEGPGVRVDSGIMAGWHVGVHYDPILAKIIVHDTTRARAVLRMQRALAETVLLGLTTNLPFLQTVIGHPEFAAGRTPIDFLDRHLAQWKAHDGRPGTDVLALAAMAEWERLGAIGTARQPSRNGGHGGDIASPWQQLGPFRLGGKGR